MLLLLCRLHFWDPSPWGKCLCLLLHFATSTMTSTQQLSRKKFLISVEMYTTRQFIRKWFQMEVNVFIMTGCMHSVIINKVVGMQAVTAVPSNRISYKCLAYIGFFFLLCYLAALSLWPHKMVSKMQKQSLDSRGTKIKWLFMVDSQSRCFASEVN